VATFSPTIASGRAPLPGADDSPAQLHDRRPQKRLGQQFFGVTGIGRCEPFLA
jgi:hypothetical protein